jgi:hypothetical protein
VPVFVPDLGDALVLPGDPPQAFIDLIPELFVLEQVVGLAQCSSAARTVGENTQALLFGQGQVAGGHQQI